jgi:hypothetical protein
MVKIKEIIHCGGESCEEADVVITDGQFDLLCFCYPCKYEKGQIFNEYIRTLDADNIIRAENQNFEVNKLSDHFSYQLSGKLIDKTKGIIAIGKINIEVGGYIPPDINEGEFISFSTYRLDV